MVDRLEWLQSKRVGLALSGGAVRGLAHIGVIKFLEQAGIKPTVLSGTSVGSIIGAALAAGMNWREIAEMARKIFWPRLLHGKTLERFSVEHLPATFEELETPFAAVATVLTSGRPLTITTGKLSSAISASCAVRILRRAVTRDGIQLKDGGFSCVLPALACRELGADFIISSDVWEWSSLMRSLGYHPNGTAKVYPSHYRRAVSNSNIHIHPRIPIRGYIPVATAVDEMIAVGEFAAERALASVASTRAA